MHACRRAAAVPVRELPFRALPEVHGSRQGGLVQGARRHGALPVATGSRTTCSATRRDAGDELKARKPLAGAEVKVEEVEGNPGYYSAKFHLRPHYQLEGVNVTMSLVAKLPSEKKA